MIGGFLPDAYDWPNTNHAPPIKSMKKGSQIDEIIMFTKYVIMDIKELAVQLILGDRNGGR